MRITFVATRDNLSPQQAEALKTWLRENRPDALHHSDRRGGDEQANQIAADLGVEIELHPPVNPVTRAFCSKGVIKEHAKRPSPHVYHDMVHMTDLTLVASDQGWDGMRTNWLWGVVRYALRVPKPVLILWPDGSMDRLGSVQEFHKLHTKIRR